MLLVGLGGTKLCDEAVDLRGQRILLSSLHLLTPATTAVFGSYLSSLC
jgi:hypothetical protein